jgi:HSP20 family molecular chaperone IbpA
MDTVKRKLTAVGIVTAILGLAVGLGIGVWGIKTSHASDASASTSNTTANNEKQDSNSATRTDQWDPFREMERMQEEIDRAIRNATEQFRLGPSATMFRPDAGYSSQFDLHDRKDHYELRAYLPDAEASDVNVKIDNDKTLRISVVHKRHEMKKESALEASVTELGQYEQIITLPEAVRSPEMKIERKGHEVIVTIPKAKNN